jgi:SAM-dependent methyltransferase
MGLEARFICSNVYDLPDVLHEHFDIVFVNYGSLSFLPDLKMWARVVSHFLKPGGRFSIVEIHPFVTVFREVDGQLRITHSLFHQEPYEWEVNVTCADLSPVPTHPEFSWPWTVGTLVTALIDAGLRIDSLRELPIDARQRVPSMIKDADGYWHLPGDPFPLVVACSAVKPG